MSACARPDAEVERPELGLIGSIPIYWGEADGVSGLLDGAGDAHWARQQLEQDYDLRPLDTLDAESLAGLRFLLAAQPRALSPAENVALDAWVRGGGHLLLFADPLLTGESRFAIGDRRRPQDVILLSPLLGHWGLDLEFDPEAPEGPRLVAVRGGAIPVDMPGRFRSGADSGCVVDGEGLLASCAIGDGHALVLADAAMLDLHHPHPQAAAALAMLLRAGF